MPSPSNNIIKYNSGEKSLELPFIIYADLEFLLKKIDTCLIILNYHQLLK